MLGCYGEKFTQWCTFLSQEVREISRFLLRRRREFAPELGAIFHAQNSNFYTKIYTTEYILPDLYLEPFSPIVGLLIYPVL